MARNQGKTTDRGYGREHQKLRKQWEPIVNAGRAYCAETTCLMDSRLIQPGSPWHLAHADGQNGYRGPAHRRCNLAERNRRRNPLRRSPWAAANRARKPATQPPPRTPAPLRTSRQW